MFEQSVLVTQLMHCVCPALGWYCPAGHAVHTAFDVVVHVDDAYVPAGHTVQARHVVWPVDGW